MTRNYKTFIAVILLCSFAVTAHAVTIYPLPVPWYERPFLKVKQCTWHLTCYFNPTLGVTITTIAGTDTLSASRSVINTNFSNLNDGKIENSTTSVKAITTLENLVSIGTITTGAWTASTTAVAYGGTGSSTLSNNKVLMGRGANGVAVIGGGSSGQFLTHQGDGTAPTWTTAAIDQAGNYAWTGYHSFSATTTFGSNAKVTFSGSTTQNTASGTVYDVKNGLTYAWPTSVASSTVLTSNANGTLYWMPPSSITTFMPSLVTATSTFGITQVNANTTALCGLWNLPAQLSIGRITLFSEDTAGTAGTLDIGIYSENGNTKFIDVTTGSVSANDTFYTTAVSPAVTLTAGNYYMCIVPNGTADVQITMHRGNNGFWNTNPSSEPVYGGVLTVTAGTLPATFDPTALTGATAQMLFARFDN